MGRSEAGYAIERKLAPDQNSDVQRQGRSQRFRPRVDMGELARPSCPGLASGERGPPRRGQAPRTAAQTRCPEACARGLPR